MKLTRYKYNNEESYGLLNGQTVICLPDLARRLNLQIPLTLEKFIIAGKTARQKVETLLGEAVFKDVQATSLSLKKISLIAPVAYPPKILGLGWNYVDHTEETKTPPPEEPVVFMKPRTAIIGPDDAVVKPAFVKELDYEGELAVVIEKKAKDVAESEALNYVFGFTIFNDVSARDFQFKDKQWTRGKGFDTFAPMGPCIVTSDQLPNVGNLEIHTWVNGELRQNGNTHDMIFNISQIIYHLSRVMTLEPGDIIATGTPSGVGMAMKPQRWLKSGDVVQIEIQGIGILKNYIIQRIAK